MPIADGNSVGIRSTANKSQFVSATSINGKLAQDLFNIENLYTTVFSKLVSYMNNYSIGAFETFEGQLTEEVILDITQEINNTVYIEDTTVLNNPNLYFILSDPKLSLPEKYVEIANEIMNVMKQTLNERIRMNRLITENEKNMTYKEILEDPQKLNDYIKEVQSTSYLFTAEATYQQPIEIKPWYQQYLIQYGPPGDGVFDSEKLGVIIQQLIAIGQISEDTVIS